DFTIYNIIVDHRDIVHVLDFGDTKRSTNIEDVVRMYSGLWAISQTSAYRKKIIGPVLDDFFHAYNIHTDVKNTRFFKILMAYNFVTHLLGQHSLKGLVSSRTLRDLDKITKAGIAWIESQLI
ncbi:MAG: hypothetical protein LAT66_12520, partial [Alkalimonas sp.]|nr:hypothetical protein [Alkalimonas sp.]